MENFQIGQFVRVINNDKTYNIYYRFFKELKFQNTDRNDGFVNGTIAQIFGTCFHELSGLLLLALVDENGNECLISYKGVELLSFERKKEFKFQINEYDAVISKDKFTVGCQNISKETWKLVCEKVKEYGFDKD